MQFHLSKTVLYTHILNTHILHELKSFKHEKLFYLCLYMASEDTFVISTAQTDLSPRSRTLSVKTNKLPTFCEINLSVAIFKNYCLLWSDMFKN